ncbi:hypothetical protein [Inquilinus sp.]|jgi:hypothetical protein|uniref:hypothetical protein n=1 Tax=Inquilinus sp. TaxID=1932117 RepID=UPI0037852781
MYEEINRDEPINLDEFNLDVKIMGANPKYWIVLRHNSKSNPVGPQDEGRTIICTADDVFGKKKRIEGIIKSLLYLDDTTEILVEVPYKPEW